jgi:hypothetical protein
LESSALKMLSFLANPMAKRNAVVSRRPLPSLADAANSPCARSAMSGASDDEAHALLGTGDSARPAWADLPAEGLALSGASKRMGGKHTTCTHLTWNGTFRRANRCRQCRELRTPSLVKPTEATPMHELVYKNPTCCHVTNTEKPQERCRCIACRQLKKPRNQLSMADAGGSIKILVAACVDDPNKRKNAFLSGAVSDAIEGLAFNGGRPRKRAGGKHAKCTHLTWNGTFRRANRCRQCRELRLLLL